jgi:hypothetical protein
MSTDAVGSDIQAFHEFLSRRMDDPSITPEQSVLEFRAYQEELRRAQIELGESRDEFLQGKARPLDVEALMARVRSRLDRQENV